MAVDDPPPATHPAGPRPATTREIIQITGAAIALVAVIFAGMSVVVSLTLAPMREDMRLLRGEISDLRNDVRKDLDGLRQEMNGQASDLRKDMNALRQEMNGQASDLRKDLNDLRQDTQKDMNSLRQIMHDGFKAVDAEFQEVREDLAGIRERLTRVEVLLERDRGQSDAPTPPRQE